MNLTLALPPELVDAIAERVVALLAPQATDEPWRLLSVDDVAARLGRSTRWVRDHKDEIGWVRLDGGALAFELADVRAFAQSRRIACVPLADVPPSRAF